MADAVAAWRAMVVARQQQMDAAYARVDRSSGDFWGRATRVRHLSQRLPEDDPGLRVLRRLTTPASTVLDVGAGAGRYARAIAPFVQRVVAVEPNATLAQHLRDAAAADCLLNIDLVVERWEDAAVPPADVTLCAHVLYPHADIEGWVRRLVAHTREQCVIVATTIWPEPPLMLELWQQFHGEPRHGQPDARHVWAALYDMGIVANVEVGAADPTGSQWAFASLDDAIAHCREHLIIAANPQSDSVLADALATTLVRHNDGTLRLPHPHRAVCAIWWQVRSASSGH